MTGDDDKEQSMNIPGGMMQIGIAKYISYLLSMLIEIDAQIGYGCKGKSDQNYQNFSLSLLETYFNCEYTLPGGVPMMRLQSESLALRILAKLPMRWMVLSARMMRVLVAFSIAFLVLPFSPEIRAMQRARWSPCRFFTSLIWKVSRKRSSSRSMAMASSRLKPSMNARRKSQVRWMAERSSVSSHSLISTVFFFRFSLICSFMFLTTVSHIFSQLFLRGVMRLGGIMTDCCSKVFLACCCAREGRGCSAGSMTCSACIVEVIGLQMQAKYSDGGVM